MAKDVDGRDKPGHDGGEVVPCGSAADHHLSRMKTSATGIAVGVAIGTGIGVAIDNIAMGIGIGIAIGIAMGQILKSPDDRQ